MDGRYFRRGLAAVWVLRSALLLAFLRLPPISSWFTRGLPPSQPTRRRVCEGRIGHRYLLLMRSVMRYNTAIINIVLLFISSQKNLPIGGIELRTSAWEDSALIIVPSLEQL